MWPLPQRPLYLRVEDVGIGPQKRGRQLLYPSVMWINVALSRAKCLAIVVGDPRIGGAAAGSIEEMMLINLFCKVACA